MKIAALFRPRRRSARADLSGVLTISVYPIYLAYESTHPERTGARKRLDQVN